jgi:hypothetical protein
VINKPAHGELHFLPALNFSQSGIIFVGIVQFQNEIQMNYLQFLLTENDSGIRNEVELQPLPELDLPVNLADAPERGWRKLTIFKRGFGGSEFFSKWDNICGYCPISKRNTDELPSIFVGFFLKNFPRK